jgi:protein tyrosine phosphatase
MEIQPADARKSPRMSPIVNLRRYYEERCSNGQAKEGDRLEDEFSYLDSIIFKSVKVYAKEGRFETAQRSENALKNRYGNILPFEKTRVRLRPLDGAPSSDYINANHIEGSPIGLSHSYIATQGPMETTAADFWRMIWEQEVNVIVMLAAFREGVKEQCFKYFPHAGEPDVDTGLFCVSCISEQCVGTDGIVERRFRVTCKFPLYNSPDSNNVNDYSEGCETERIVRHYQYDSWQDFGVPRTTEGIRQLIAYVNAEPLRGPMVVHCSAGVGRSGTFITIHAVLSLWAAHRASPEACVPFRYDLFSVVRYLRQCRFGMVQRPEQYEFCYQAVVEAVEATGEQFTDHGYLMRAPSVPVQNASNSVLQISADQ